MTMPLNYTFSVAPMMDWTDRHCRAFHRCLSKRALLWTEMVTADAVIHGDRERLIGFSEAEHPLVLQLGGSDPEKLRQASKIAEDWGYDEVNLNCGCPSDRVQSGRFGACLMAEPDLVADCYEAMQADISIPATIKCRIAIDDLPAEETLFTFVDKIAARGCKVFTVHARKAWLKGLSPKENRDIPPLDYDLVAKLKQARPDLTIVLNGGIPGIEESVEHMSRFDGVMLGRAAYQYPALLGYVDRDVFGENGITTPERALAAYRPYMASQLERGVRLSSMTRHMLGLFAGRPGARLYRRVLSEKGPREGAGLDVLDEAVAQVHTAEARMRA